MLERVDRRAVLADQEAEIVAVDGGADLLARSRRCPPSPAARARAPTRATIARTRSAGSSGISSASRAPGVGVHLGAHARGAVVAGLVDHVEADALGGEAGEARLELLHGRPLGLAEAVALGLGHQLLGARLFAHGHPGHPLSGGDRSASSSCAARRVAPWWARRPSCPRRRRPSRRACRRPSCRCPRHPRRPSPWPVSRAPVSTPPCRHRPPRRAPASGRAS